MSEAVSISASRSGLIIREKEPANLEFPFASLTPVTPTNEFFVRTHFPIPAISAKDWTLTVDGEVEQELVLTYDDLLRLPSVTAPVLLECAGNGRAQLVPKAKGLLWDTGAVGTAEWTGVPLSAVLEKAGVKKGAVDVILQGADKGEVDDPKSPGVVHFERSLPLAKAMRPEVFLAYKMNGKDLTPDHGFPVRAIVGGWYGMASVKWLTHVTVTAAPFEGFWQSLEYAYWKRERERPTLTAVTEVQVKAQIARPALSEAVPGGKPYRVFGAAWSGESDVVRVEVSTDGKTWSEATLLGESVPFAWRLWAFQWNVPEATGQYRVMARATDTKGHTQPVKHDSDRRTYMINFAFAVEVEVV
ncbi:TMAO/DMSO reductase [Gemmata obscuriglobus]|uniref:Sulfite oxidase n=1 Tax=Gemmata obscuriglobus TaxID=114 RepID=A0A2Z3GRQ4_9BACT|nr:sulfite oxidase [Gemmata obscuriglobus]AWM37049.1 sulfite oxidase [Gemmata obscuriglobus]QEG30242.1 TMAO/DMSO reductase [Gemmata obscuriglobus]VTS09566.1 sulfite oxidase : Putative sulfite oxidase protein OS=Pedobacter sp. BAL39 GN=PBAL39_11070 PE=4 SV=1: Oxidored_molyb: Mo-co_dimer [Gemmata obscuriglobus UQM 2246]